MTNSNALLGHDPRAESSILAALGERDISDTWKRLQFAYLAKAATPLMLAACCALIRLLDPIGFDGYFSQVRPAKWLLVIIGIVHFGLAFWADDRLWSSLCKSLSQKDSADSLRDWVNAYFRHVLTVVSISQVPAVVGLVLFLSTGEAFESAILLILGLPGGGIWFPTRSRFARHLLVAGQSTVEDLLAKDKSAEVSERE